MRKKYVIGIDGSGINEMLKGINEEKRWLESKTKELTKRLAEMGATKAEVNFYSAYYDGDEDSKVVVEPRGINSYAVKAYGKTVLFVEFGSGLLGYGHPEVGEYGAGTYPPTNPDDPKWNKPGGWFYYDDAGNAHHTHGNPPNMPMYNSVKELKMELAKVVSEVFMR